MRTLFPRGALMVFLVVGVAATASGRTANMRVAVSVSPGCNIAVDEEPAAAPAHDNVVLTCSRDTYPVVTIEEVSPEVAEDSGQEDEVADSEDEPGARTEGNERQRFRVAVINF